MDGVQARDRRHGSGVEGGLALGLLVAATILYAAPLLRHPESWSHWDWDKEFGLAAAQRRAIIEHGEMPLWNPHLVGGMALFSFHESTALAPTFPLILVFGPVLGMKLRVVAGLLIGVASMWALGRRWGVDPWAAACSAVVAMLSGYLASHLWFGQPMWIALGWLPLLMLALHPERRRPRMVAVSLLMMFLEGGLDVLFMALVLATTAVLVEAFKRDPGGLAALAKGCLGLATLGAVKLLGAAHYIARAPRPTGHGPGYGWLHQMRGLGQLQVALTSSRFAEELPWTRGQWEDMAYVGWPAVLVGLAGVLLGGRRLVPWTVGMVVCFVLAMGEGGVPGLWRAFHSLPGVEQFEYPLRFAGVAVVPLALSMGLALTRLSRIPFRLARAAAVAIGATAALLPYLHTQLILGLIFWNPPMAPVTPREFHHWVAPTRYLDYASVLMNRGNLVGLLATHAPVRAVARGTPGYRGEAYLESGRGSARIAARSMTRLDVSVTAETADLLVINMNFAPGWRWDAREAREHGGLIAFEVPSGTTRVKAAFQPFDYRLGLFVTLTSLAGLAAARAAPRRPLPRRA